MVYIVLSLVGSLLVLNGLTMAGLVTAFSPVAGDPNVGALTLGYSANGFAVLNLFTGIVIALLAFCVVVKNLLDGFGETVTATVGATVLAFAAAYIALGVAVLTMYSPVYAELAKAAVPAGKTANGLVSFAALQPLGWYCLPVSIAFLVISLGFYNLLGAKLPKVPQFGTMWLLFAITFFLFFYVLGLGNYGILAMVGWWTFGVGVVTCVFTSLRHFNAGKVGSW